MMQTFALSRVRLAFLLLAAIVVAVVLGVASNAQTSDAQTTGYGPQNVPDQVIEPASSAHSSNTGLVVGAGAAVVVVAVAVTYGVRHNG